MSKNCARLAAAALALSFAFLAAGSARAGGFDPLGTWSGSYHNDKGAKVDSSKIVIRRAGDVGFYTGDWDGYKIDDMVVHGDSAEWSHRDADGKYYEVTATLVSGELRVHYNVYDSPLVILGQMSGMPLPRPGQKEHGALLYSGDGSFRK